jgi:hypothetical protein
LFFSRWSKKLGRKKCSQRKPLFCKIFITLFALLLC